MSLGNKKEKKCLPQVASSLSSTTPARLPLGTQDCLQVCSGIPPPTLADLPASLAGSTTKPWAVEKQFVHHTGLETNTAAKSHLGKPANGLQRLEFKMRFAVGVRRVLPGEVIDGSQQERVNSVTQKDACDPNTSLLAGVRLG